MDKEILYRFFKKVDCGSMCWNWMAGCSKGEKNKDGYGMFYYQGGPRNAHRISYEFFVGPIPEGLNVLHHCDNSRCVNPDHLFLGTQKDNVADMIRKGKDRLFGEVNKNKTHCPKGHEYNDANTYRYRGRRICKTCQRASNRKGALSSKVSSSQSDVDNAILGV